MDKYERFRDPVHGFIFISHLECKIINSRPFQRLRNIKQLAFTYYVFHGAEHTRFGHSLGVMHLASKAFRSAVSKNKHLFTVPTDWLEQILRIIALVHDLGHSPFSHAGEDLFPIKPGDKLGKRYSHEDMTRKIVIETEIGEIIKEIGVLSRQKHGEQYDITPELICDIYAGKNEGIKPYFIFLNTFMDSELDCDKMDYLLRDSLYCGVNYGRYDIERLISCLTIFENKEMGYPRLGIEKGGVQAFEAFVLARYFMFIQVYFHRVRRFFDKMLYKALKECLPGGEFPIATEDYLKWDDISVIELLRKHVDVSKSAATILRRECWKEIYETKPHPNSDGRKLFSSVVNQLREKIGENFLLNTIIDTSADKSPHKINTLDRDVIEEDTIAIVDETGYTSTIAQESYIISNIRDNIDIRRIYASPIVSDAAKMYVEKITTSWSDS